MKISLLQWNILYKEKLKNIENLLKSSKADVICLQELVTDSSIHGSINSADYLAKALAYNYHYCEAPVTGSSQIKSIANGIFSRFPIKNKSCAWIQKPRRPTADYSNQHRAYAEVELMTPRDRLNVGTTHMSYTHRFINTAKKQKEAAKLTNLIKHHKKRYVLLGDLNSLPYSFTVKRIKKYLKHAGPAMSEPTFSTKLFEYKGFVETKLNWRLDYVFASKDIKVLSSQILKTNYSDHLPVLVEIDLGQNT